jgi:glycosyltransferase involved in cell wall biosynthesis/spore maturation protein CgeB
MKSRSVLLFNTEPWTRNYYIIIAIADALRRHPSVGRLVLASHENAVHKLINQKLDTFIAFGGSETHTELLARLCYLSDLSILWTTEDPYQLSENVRWSTCFDVVFSNDKASVPAYGGNAYHLPLAASPLFQDFSVRNDDREYMYDLLFLGTAWPNRVKSLNCIMSAFGAALKVKLALPWNDFIGPPQLHDRELLTDWRCGNTDFARFANRSRIVLTLPRHFSASSEKQAVGSTPPPRLFETALAGGFQIMVSPEPEAQLYYEPGTEILTCGSDDAAISAIREMLVAPARRIAMAERARVRTIREHLYSHRIHQMLELASTHTRHSHACVGSNTRKVVLFVSHNRQGRLPGGGVEIYQEMLAEYIGGYDVIFFFPTVSGGRTLLCVEGDGISRVLECGTMNRRLINDAQIEGFFEEILFEERIDVVHFHHLLDLPLSLPLIARASGVPVVWQIHDYYLICDRFNLLTFDGRFCDVVHRGSDQCDACLSSKDDRPPGAKGLPPGSKGRRDGFMALVVGAVDAFIASTPFSANYLRGFFPEIEADRVNIIELPSVRQGNTVIGVDREGAPSKRRLDVAIPGNFTETKGGRYLIDLMRLCEDYDIHFHIFGRVEEHLLAPLDQLRPGRITVGDGYDHKQIIPLMGGCEVSLHLSTWPETYMLSLTEAWEAHLVPIVANLGAPGERVVDGVDGFLVPPNDPAAAFDCLQRLYFDRNVLSRMREAVAKKSFVKPREHLAALESLYERLVARHPCPHVRVPDQMPRGYNMTLFDAGIRVNSRLWSTRDNFWDGHEMIASPSIMRSQPVDLCDLPPAHSALPLEIADPKGSFIDCVEVDGRVLKTGTRDVAFQDLFVKGWLFDRRYPDTERRYLRLRTGIRTIFAPLDNDHRPDVAAHFGHVLATQTGFKATVAVGRLASGLYKADIMQAGNGCMLVLPEAFRFAVQSPKEFGLHYAPAWRHVRSPGFFAGRSLTASLAQAHITEQNLDTIADVAIGRERDTWWMKGFGLIDTPQAEPPTAVLENEVGEIVYRTIVRPSNRTDAGAESNGFNIVSQLRGLAVGAYTLKVAYIEKHQVIIQPTGMRLFRAPADVSFCWSTTPPPAYKSIPPGFKSSWIKSNRLKVVIDQVWRSGGSLSGEDDLILLRGWSFARNLGVPRSSFITWSDGGRTRYCISDQILRPDVVDERKEPQALASGFELGIPRNALDNRPVRFFQCYSRQTLEFHDFDVMFRALISG